MPAWIMHRRAKADTSAIGPQSDTVMTAGRPAPGADGWLMAASETDDLLSPSARWTRRAIISGIIVAFLIAPTAAAAWRNPSAVNLTALAVALVFVALVIWVAVTPSEPGARGTPWAWLVVIVALAITGLTITGNGNWVTGLAVAAAACGRFSRTIRPAVFGSVTLALAGLVVGLAQHSSEGGILAVIATPAMGAFFAYSAGKRNEAVMVLRRTQAELARAAVAEERLRIARDLHDLLGHSLSLITLKAELSRRLIGTDAARATAEIADLESVARQSLSDVREAVAGYRQPDLAAELAAAHELLVAAGIACQITAPDPILLPGEVDAVLAWTIREGITNVVRHSRAARVAITVAVRATATVVEITNDAAGPGPAPAQGCRSGSGLAGLRERVQALGGNLTAGPSEPGGFRLRVSVPAGSRTPRPQAEIAGS